MERKFTLTQLNLATFSQGLVAGTLLTHVVLKLNSSSLLLASVFSALYVLGNSISRILKGVKTFHLNLAGALARVALFASTLVTSTYLSAILPLSFGFLLAIISRRQFIDLKRLTGSIKVKELTRHGSFNAVGYGIGSAVSALILNSNIFTLSVIIIAILIAYLFYPEFKNNDKYSSGGLSKRDVAVAIFFTAAITPLGNAVVLLAISRLYGDKLSGLGVLAYTLGSLLSHQIARYLRARSLPIAKSIWLSSIIFIPILLTGNIFILLASRFITGALLYSAQGLLEERTHKDIDSGKGLDFLWTIFSLVAFLLLLILPKAGEHFGFYILPIISFSLAIVISFLRKIFK